MKKALIVGLISLLSGCGGVSDKVSEMASPADPSITIGENLESRAVCVETSWDTQEDDMGREIVTFNCRMDDIGDYFDKSVSSYRENAKRNLDATTNSSSDFELRYPRLDLQQAQDKFARLQVQIESPEESFAEQQRGLYDSVDDYVKTLQRWKSDAEARIAKAKAKIESIKENAQKAKDWSKKEYADRMKELDQWNVTSADETMTWLINAETGEPKYAGSVISVYSADDALIGEKVQQNQFDLKNRLSLALINQDSKTYTDYYYRGNNWTGNKVQ